MPGPQQNLLDLVHAATARGGFEWHEVKTFMAEIRELLEAQQLGTTFPLAKIFGDWCLHPAIDRAGLGHRALAAIAEAFKRHDDPKDPLKTFELGDLVNDQLSFIRLRLDLIRLCHRFGVPYTFLTTVEAWKQFAVGLIRVLADKPIALPAAPDKAKQARADIDAIRAAIGFAPIQIAIGHPMPDGEPYWIMPVDGGKTMITRLFIGIYKPEDFPFPAGWTP